MDLQPQSSLLLTLRDKLNISGITGTFAVGNTVTGSSSGASATVTYVAADQSFLYVTTGAAFSDAQVDTISNGSGASATLDTLSGGVFRYFINLNDGNGVQEAPSFTLIDQNTYRFDTSDSSNLNHPLSFGAATNLSTRQEGTPGQAGSYFEVIVGDVSTTTSTSTYTCANHGITMSEDSTITYTTGAAGQAGDQMSATAVVASGVVTTITILAQGTGYNLNDVLLIDDSVLGGNGGSGFQFTIQSNKKGIY